VDKIACVILFCLYSNSYSYFCHESLFVGQMFHPKNRGISGGISLNSTWNVGPVRVLGPCCQTSLIQRVIKDKERQSTIVWDFNKKLHEGNLKITYPKQLWVQLQDRNILTSFNLVLKNIQHILGIFFISKRNISINFR